MKTKVRKGFYLHLHDKVYNPGEDVELEEADYQKNAHMLEPISGVEALGATTTVPQAQLGMDMPPELEGKIISRKPPAFILEDVGGDPDSIYKVSATAIDVSGQQIKTIDPLTENVTVEAESATDKVAPVEGESATLETLKNDPATEETTDKSSTKKK